MYQDIDSLLKEAQFHMGKAHEKQGLYYNIRRKELKFKMDDFVLFEKYWLRSRWQKRVSKFHPKFVGSFELLEKLRMDKG